MATINSGNSTTLYSTTQTTTSVNTATNLPQDRVNETNFTTLYSNTTASATGGGTSGNLLVSGNLRVLGTSDLEGAVTIGNSYILPTSDGTVNQVILTDGNGNLTFQNISAVANYAIQADTATSGANLTLTNSGSPVDAVKFANGTGISISRTDANTITVTNTAPDTNITYTINASATTGGANFNLVGSDATTDTIKFAGSNHTTVTRTDANTITIADSFPDGTAQGQVLYWNGTDWTASSNIASSAANNRLVLQYNNSTAGTNNALFLRKNYGATNYSEANNDGVGLNYSLISNSQGISSYGVLNFEYSATDPQLVISSSTDNFTNTNDLLILQKSTALLYAPNITLNAKQTGTPTLNATITAERGSLTNATLTWNESTDTWNFNNSLTVTGVYSQTGETLTINSDSTAADSYLYLKGTSVAIKYNNSTNFIEMPRTSINNITLDTNTISTVTGNLILTSTGGTVAVNNILNVDSGTLYVDPVLNCVGINTTSPGYSLEVQGDAYINSNLTVHGSTFLGNSYISDVTHVVGEFQVSNATTANLFVDHNTGYVGIGDSTPSTTLDVGGNTNVQGIVTVQGDSVTINSDKTNLDVYLNFGRVAPSANAAIRWNHTTNTFEWSEDSSTWHQFIDATLTAPFYNGQLLSYRNGEWINDNEVVVTTAAQRSSFRYRPLSPTAGYSSSLFLTKDYSAAATGSTGVGTYTDGSGVALAFNVDSDSQSIATFANIAGLYSTTNPSITLNTSTDNFASNDLQVASFDSTTTSLSAGSLILSSENTGAATDSYLYANRGSTGADAFLQWSESNSWWGSSSNLFAAGGVIGASYIATNGNNIYFNNEDGAAADCFLQVKRGASDDVNIKWNESTDRWQTTTDGSNYLNIPNQNLDTTDSVSFAQLAIDGQASLDTATLTTTQNTTPVALITSARNVMNVLVYIVQGANTHCVNATVLRNGASAMLTTYGEMYNNIVLANFTADIGGTSIRLLVQPTLTSSTAFSAVRTSLT